MRNIEIESNFQISADSQEEEFHENLIYGSGMFRKQSTAEDADSGLMSMADPKATPTTKIQSPFASSDSLNTRDHSDGIWNESQTTVMKSVKNKLLEIIMYSKSIIH